MKILFDNGVPQPIAAWLVGHQVSHARKIGWHELENGELIRRAEAEGYDLLLSTDKNIRYQQNLKSRKIALVILSQQQWPLVKSSKDHVIAAVNAVAPDSYIEVEMPLQTKHR